MAQGYGRMWFIEALRYGAILPTRSVAIPVTATEAWVWSSWDFDGQSYRLEMEQHEKRRYVLHFDTTLMPSDEILRAAIAGIPKRRRRQRKPKEGDGGSTKTAHPPPLERSVRVLGRFVRARFRRGLRACGRELHEMKCTLHMETHRCFATIQRIGGSVVRHLRSVVATARTVSQTIRLETKSVYASLYKLRECPADAMWPDGQYEPRIVAPNSGLHLVLYSLVADEAIPWEEYLFGVDWNLNLFGVKPEEELVPA
jgi:hypothetical protein